MAKDYAVDVMTPRLLQPRADRRTEENKASVQRAWAVARTRFSVGLSNYTQ